MKEGQILKIEFYEDEMDFIKKYFEKISQV